MTRVAGFDGSRGGWVAVLVDGGDPATARAVFATDMSDTIAKEVIDLALIDAPIGLTDGPTPRDTDAAMRAFLKGKTSSVFSTPARAVMAEPDYASASMKNHEILNRKITKQTFMILPAIRAAESAARRFGQSRVREGHPEVSFAVMNDRPVLSRKRSAQGRADRAALLAAAGFDAAAIAATLPRRVPTDDLHDACVLAWSALRATRNRHVTFPAAPSTDSTGLQMSVWA